MGGSHPRVVQCPAAQVHHGGRDLGKAQHFAAIFSSKPLRVGLLREAADATPAWEAAKSAPRSSVSANIKPKRKVAALFKAAQPETSVQ